MPIIVYRVASWVMKLKLFITGVIVFGLFSKTAEAKNVDAIAWNQFTQRIEKDLPKNKSGVLSGLSIWITLAMLESGAEKQSKQELRESLGLGELKLEEIEKTLKSFTTSKEFELSIANSLWPSYKHKYQQEYITNIARYFNGELHSLDYEKDSEAARKQINNWAKQKTNSKIQEILAPGKVTPETLFILANAIYFKAKWEDPFQSQFTKDADFQATTKSTRKVSMMNQTAYHQYFEDSDLQALSMNYRGGEVYLLAVLPHPGVDISKAGLDHLGPILKGLKEQRVIVSLPRFKIETDLDGLPTRLQKLGIKRIFDPTQSELTKIMSPTNDTLYVSNIIHRALIEVNEEGTEATAVTISEMLAGGMPPREKPIVFLADRPFRFYIIHRNTKSIMFSGQYF